MRYCLPWRVVLRLTELIYLNYLAKCLIYIYNRVSNVNVLTTTSRSCCETLVKCVNYFKLSSVFSSLKNKKDSDDPKNYEQLPAYLLSFSCLQTGEISVEK